MAGKVYMLTLTDRSESIVLPPEKFRQRLLCELADQNASAARFTLGKALTLTLSWTAEGDFDIWNAGDIYDLALEGDTRSGSRGHALANQARTKGSASQADGPSFG